jgi:hypothetical protein
MVLPTQSWLGAAGQLAVCVLHTCWATTCQAGGARAGAHLLGRVVAARIDAQWPTHRAGLTQAAGPHVLGEAVYGSLRRLDLPQDLFLASEKYVYQNSLQNTTKYFIGLTKGILI